MHKLPKFVDLKKSPAEMAEDKVESCVVGYSQSLYPYGLCIYLENDTLEKLDLSSDVDAGDMVYLQAVGKVTSVNKRDTEKGPDNRVEIQLTHIALSEEHEDEEPKKPKPDYRKFYKDED